MRVTIFCKRNIWLFFLGWAVTASSQKLPNIQESSQWLPRTTKIDGKLAEWGNTLQAYNKATGIEYILANDSKNLYLGIRSRDKGIVAKILVGGITFMLNPAGKSVSEQPVITFPVAKPESIVQGHPAYKLRLDSADVQTAILSLKEIKVFNFNGISDSLLSIYNENNIKSKLAYVNGALISELVIPLDLISLSSQSPAFTYRIILNGISSSSILIETPKPGSFTAPPPVRQDSSRSVPSEGSTIAGQAKFPTDFSGKYTLSKE